ASVVGSDHTEAEVAL
nr:55-56 kda glycoprotein/esterase/lipase homolog {internal fragment} [Lepidochelys kempi=Kemp's ridley sea turtles, Rathke's gland secretions, Peptide Partial, 15 aa] [Lepidochelys kempii]